VSAHAGYSGSKQKSDVEDGIELEWHPSGISGEESGEAQQDFRPEACFSPERDSFSGQD
jgi:hypothetical protein